MLLLGLDTKITIVVQYLIMATFHQPFLLRINNNNNMYLPQ